MYSSIMEYYKYLQYLDTLTILINGKWVTIPNPNVRFPATIKS